MWSVADVLCPKSRGAGVRGTLGRSWRSGDFGRMWSVAGVLCPKSWGRRGGDPLDAAKSPAIRRAIRRVPPTGPMDANLVQ